jgi:CBS domain-containing protein
MPFWTVEERSTEMTSPDSDAAANAEGTEFHGPDAPVRIFVSADIITIAPSASVRDAAVAIADASIGMLVIGTADEVAAVVSERDIVRAVAQQIDLDDVAVIDIGSTDLVWVDADELIGAAAEEMMKDYVRHALVRDESGLVGVLSMRDALSAYTT